MLTRYAVNDPSNPGLTVMLTPEQAAQAPPGRLTPADVGLGGQGRPLPASATAELERLRTGSDEAGQYTVYRDWDQGGQAVRQYGMGPTLPEPETTEAPADRYVGTTPIPGGAEHTFISPTGQVHRQTVIAPPGEKTDVEKRAEWAAVNARQAAPPAVQATAPTAPAPRYPGLRFGSEREINLAQASGELSGQDAERQRNLLTLAQPNTYYSTPERMATTHVQTTREGGVSPENQAAIEDAIAAEADAKRLRAVAEGSVAAAAATNAQRQAEEDIKRIGEDQARRAQVDARMKQLHTEQDSAIAQFKSGAIDPDRYFKQKGMGARIVAAIAVALGAFGAALTNGQNYALQILQSNIDRDIEAQRAELDKAKTVADLTGNQLAELTAAYGSPEAAEASIRERYWAAVGAQGDALMKRRNLPEQQVANFAVIEAERQKQQALARAQFDASMRGRVTEDVQLMPGRSGMTGPTAAQRAAAGEELAKGEAAQKPEDISRVINFGGQPRGVVKGETQAKAVQERLNAAEGFLRSLDELESANKNWRVVGLNRKNRAKMSAIVTDAGMQYKDFRQMGTLDAGTQRALDQLLPTESGWTGENQVRIDAMRKQVRGEINTLLSNSVVNPQTAVGVAPAAPAGARRIE